MKIVKCDYCGKEFKIPPSREKFKNHFCCAKCHHKFMEQNITLICDYCGKEFSLPTKEYNKKLKRNQKQIFCSKECSGFGRRKKRKIIEHDNYISIFYKEFEILLDKDDVKRLDINSIYALKKETDNTPYAFLTGGKSLHRFLTNCPKNMVVDHINHNGLDNRKENLRICTPSENSLNKIVLKTSKSRITGVTWCNTMKKWKVSLERFGKNNHGGYFDNLEDARKARELLEIKVLGSREFINKVESERL